MGVKFATFHSVGNSPVSRVYSNKSVKGCTISSLVTYSTLLCIPSGPGELLSFSFCNISPPESHLYHCPLRVLGVVFPAFMICLVYLLK